MATKLMTAAGGGITLDAASTATDKTVTIPARTGNVAIDGPAFSAYRATNQTGISSAVSTKLQINTERFDTNSNYDKDTLYRFTPSVEGYYQVNYRADLNGTGLNYAIAQLFKNGSVYENGSYQSAASNEYVSTGSSLVYLNGSTDYIELYVLGTVSSGTIQAIGGSVLTGFSASMVRGA